MFGTRLALLSVTTATASPSALRGARQLQWTGNSNDKVLPECKAGYNDVSGGSAYYWSCAFHCEGGAYFATEGCICACLTPEQEMAWRGMVTTTPPQPFSPLDLATPEPGKIYVTPPPSTTRMSSEPVAAIPLGETHSEATSPGVPGDSGPAVLNPNLRAATLETPTVAPKADVWHNEALDLPVVMISLAVAGGLAGAALLCFFCCNWRLLLRMCARKDVPPKAPYATPPVLRLYADPSNKTSPACFVEVPSSRASSKMSTAASLPSTSRRSSKASTASQPKERESLQLPRNDDATGISSIESITSWAHEHRTSLQAPSNFPGRSSRSGSKTSSASQDSRLLRCDNAPRSSSRNSAASQDRRRPSQTSAAVAAVVPPRKVSKVQPIQPDMAAK